MILLIDNYDSFTYNVKQEIEILGFECTVIRNDQLTLAEFRALKPEKVVISPGPGRPESSGISLQLIAECSGKIPLLGICLGHQALGFFHGAKVIRGKKPMHGKISKITHQNTGVFRGLKPVIKVARYHSLVIDRDSLPKEVEITAVSDDGAIMGVRSLKHKHEGVQFHPESFATENGRSMLKEFLMRDES